MSEQQINDGGNYRVVFLGLADPSDANLEAFSEQLSLSFRIPVEKALRIAKRAPIVVGKDVSRSKAERYQQVFEGLGGQVRIERIDTAPVSPPDEASPPRAEGFEATSVVSSAARGETSDPGLVRMDAERADDPAITYDNDIAGAYEDGFSPPSQGSSGSPAVSSFRCPQCGYEQQKGIECVKCGIIFEKYERIEEARNQAQAEVEEPPEEGQPIQENFEVSIEPAGFWIRVGAYVVDGVIVNLLLAAVGICFVLLLGGGMNPMAMASLGSFVYAITFLLPLAYYVYFLGKKGYTPGKGFLGLQVIRQDGTGLSYGDAAIRTFSYILSAIPLYLGFFWIGFDRNKQGWHDKIAKTQVIKAEEVSSWRKLVVLIPAILIPLIGVVAAIGVPVYIKFSSRALVARAVSEMQTVKTHLEEHYYRYDSYPLTGEYRSFLNSTFSRIPRDPFNRGRPYGYESDGTTFILWSIGPDRVDDRARISYDPFSTPGFQQRGDIVIYSDEGPDRGGELFGMNPSPS